MKTQPSSFRSIFIFFILTFTLGWLAWVPIIVSQAKWAAFIFLFSPAISALLVISFTEKLTGLKEILRLYFRWKFPIKWYLISFLLIPTLMLLAILILSRDHGQSLWLHSPWYFVGASFLYLMFINSGEEIGWRGFALPHLQNRFGHPLFASIVLGLIWGAWHLPQYFVPDKPNIPLMPFLLLTVSLSIIYTVVFNNTQGSLLLAVILHASTDIIPRIVRIGDLSSDIWWLIDALILMAGMGLYLLTNAPTLLLKSRIKTQNE